MITQQAHDVKKTSHRRLYHVILAPYAQGVHLIPVHSISVKQAHNV